MAALQAKDGVSRLIRLLIAVIYAILLIWSGGKRVTRQEAKLSKETRRVWQDKINRWLDTRRGLYDEGS